MDVPMHRAKAELTKLVAAAERGERVTITRHGRPVVALMPMTQTGGFVFSLEDPVRASCGLPQSAVAVSVDVDNPTLSNEVLTGDRQTPALDE